MNFNLQSIKKLQKLNNEKNNVNKVYKKRLMNFQIF